MLYRCYEKRDLPQLFHLWEHEAMWGPMDEKKWQEWYVDTPAGEAVVIVAEDESRGQVVGQMVFTPARVWVNGRVVHAARPSAPIISSSFRFAPASDPLQHPVASMHLTGIDALKEGGCQLLYMLPYPGWSRFLEMFSTGIVTGSFPLFSVPVVGYTPVELPLGLKVRKLEIWDSKIDDLWSRTSSRHRCCVVRDRAALSFKIPLTNYEVFGIERGSELVAVVCSTQKGQGQWLICDILGVDDEALGAAVAEGCNAGFRKGLSNPDQKISKAGILTTPAMEPLVRALGFKEDRYQFPFAVQALSPSVSEVEIAPHAWYVSAND